MSKNNIPRVILIGGYSGTGKSTLSRALKQALPEKENWLVLDADVVRKELWGVDPLTTLPDEAYSMEMHIKLADEMIRRMKNAVQNGRSVISNSTYLNAEGRDKVENQITALGVPATGLFLTADQKTLKKRIRNRKEDPSDVTPTVLSQQFNGEKITFSNFWRVVDSRCEQRELLSFALECIDQKTRPEQDKPGPDRKPPPFHKSG